jgi:hypothetical protein
MDVPVPITDLTLFAQSSGCPVDLAKQVSCEMCQPGSGVEHAGGYDEKFNQARG